MKKNRGYTFVELMITVAIISFGIIGFVAASRTGCSTNNGDAIRALENNGFSKINIMDSGVIGVGWHGCDNQDGAYYEIEANNPVGHRVQMIVCCGGPLSWKGCTVRSK